MSDDNGEWEYPVLDDIVLTYIHEAGTIRQKRLKALIFYTEMKSLVKTRQLLTDAPHAPVDEIPFENAVDSVVDTLSDNKTIKRTDTGKLTTFADKPDLTPKEEYMVDRFTTQTERMTTHEVITRAKQTWAWRRYRLRNITENLNEFANSITHSNHPLRVGYSPMKQEPVKDPDLERLLSE